MGAESQSLPQLSCLHRKLSLLAGIIILVTILVFLFFIWAWNFCYRGEKMSLAGVSLKVFVFILSCVHCFSQVSEAPKVPVTPGAAYHGPSLSSDQPYLWAARERQVFAQSCCGGLISVCVCAVHCTIKMLIKCGLFKLFFCCSDYTIKCSLKTFTWLFYYK